MKRLEAACNEKDGQIHLLLQNIEEWKQRNHQQDKYIEELKKYQDLCKDYEFKMGQLTNEIERLNNVIKNYIQENENQRARIADLELQTGQMRSLEARIKEYENRIVMITSEINRLNEVIGQRTMEVQEWKDKCKQLEVTIINLKVFEEKCREYEQQIRSLSQMLSDEKAKYSNLERLYEQAKLLEVKIREYENKVILLTQEIERLNNVIGQKL